MFVHQSKKHAIMTEKSPINVNDDNSLRFLLKTMPDLTEDRNIEGMEDTKNRILDSFGTIPLEDMTLEQITHELHFINPEIGTATGSPARLQGENEVVVHVADLKEAKIVLDIIREWSKDRGISKQKKLKARKMALENQALQLLKDEYEPDLNERSTDVKRAFPNYGTVVEVNDAHVILDVGTPGKSYIPWRMVEGATLKDVFKGDVLEHLYIGGLVTRTYWRPLKNKITYKEDTPSKFDGSGLKEYPDIFPKYDLPPSVKDDDYKLLEEYQRYSWQRRADAKEHVWQPDEDDIHQFLTSPDWLVFRGFVKKEK
jgi:hypothetical protein